MPFTVSHAAAAWPLRASVPRLPLVPLVIGTLSPDFEYFYRLAPVGRTFHNLPGIVFFCLPVSLAVGLVFDRLVRPYASAVLPRTFQVAKAAGRPSLLVMVAAILLGAASHVVWDAFTHGDEAGVAYVPALLSPVELPGGGSAPWHRVLQHTSTAVGLAAIGGWMWRVQRRSSAAMREACRADLRSAAPTLLRISAVAVACATANGAVGWIERPYAGITRAAVGGMVGLVIAVVVLAMRHRGRARATPVSRRV